MKLIKKKWNKKIWKPSIAFGNLHFLLPLLAHFKDWRKEENEWKEENGGLNLLVVYGEAVLVGFL